MTESKSKRTQRDILIQKYPTVANSYLVIGNRQSDHGAILGMVTKLSSSPNVWIVYHHQYVHRVPAYTPAQFVPVLYTTRNKKSIPDEFRRPLPPIAENTKKSETRQPHTWTAGFGTRMKAAQFLRELENRKEEIC